MYTRDDEVGWEQSCAFRDAFSITVQVDFLGVWYWPFVKVSVFAFPFLILPLPGTQ